MVLGIKKIEDTENYNGKITKIVLKRCTIVPFIIAFIFINAILASIFNFYSIAKKIENNYFFSIDLRTNLSQTDKEDIEKSILEIYGVKSVKYVSHELSFKELQEQLGIAIPESENSLSDSMIVYFKNKNDLSNLQDRLESMENVKEAFIDLTHISFREEQAKFYKLLVIMLGGIFLIPLFILIAFIFYNGFSIEFLNKYNNDYDERKARIGAKWTNILPMIISAVVGTLIFLNLYVFLRGVFIGISYNYTILSLKEFLIPQAATIAVFALLIMITPFWPAKRNNGDDY
jgi:cell division protein FtsX